MSRRKRRGQEDEDDGSSRYEWGGGAKGEPVEAAPEAERPEQKKAKAPKDSNNQVVATNRKARHNYSILETYEAGVEYDVPAATLKANPDYFKSSGRPSNKMAGTDEDKSAGGDEEAVEAEAAE